ncbi:uncharacterized protein [Apostichopus japonicus]|uniref:uncharacterized protein isoform X2 n=1 Tax=Stichopus japonicus TaxID=307972 RepID=UPI003AB5CAD1
MASEAIGGDRTRYTMASDIQNAGCLLYYILSDGHMPYETCFPYHLQPHGILRNRQNNDYSLHHIPSSSVYGIAEMLHPEPNNRPSIEACLQLFRENSPGDDSTEEQVETTKGKRFLDMDQEIDDAADSTDQKMSSCLEGEESTEESDASLWED